MEREQKYSRTERKFPQVPGYAGEIEVFRGVPIHRDKFYWQFGQRQIPVFSIWNYDHHDEIAAMIAKGKAAAMYMWGTFGTGMLLNSPEWQQKGQQASAKLRTHLKKGRPWGEKFANFMHPDDMIDFWDIDRLHPNYAHLQWAASRHKLYQAGPVHIIAPTKRRNPHLDPSLIKEDDYTSSYFYMPHPAWDRVVKLLRREVKHAVFGGGSLNFHKEEPAFTTQTLHKMITEKPDWQQNIDFVVIDEIAEWSRINRSQTQIRLPLAGSDGICEIVRYGGLDPTRWSKFTGYPVKEAVDGVKFASSQSSYLPLYNRMVDELLAESVEFMRSYHQKVSACY